jgi:8-oxo-dGTP pyrophosphatase MutT (NUDIX family)
VKTDGMTRAELDKVENRDFALTHKLLRPRDAATLILLDRSKGKPKVLLGRRHMRHAFMPGRFVFPGGRTDPTDSRIPIAGALHPDVEKRIAGDGARATPARARAIALSAIRETYEEAGLLIGRKAPFASPNPHWSGFVEHGVHPTLERIRFIARAVTPPGRVRRFDTRFLAAWRDDVAAEIPGGGPTGELEELVWLPIADAQKADIPAITKEVLADLDNRLAADPELSPDSPAFFYRMLHNRMIRQPI